MSLLTINYFPSFFLVQSKNIDNKANCNTQLSTIDMWSCITMTLPILLKIVLNYKLSNWLTSSTNMWFYIRLNEVQSSTYIFNCFKIMDTLHIDTCHIVKHLIGMWDVTISFDMVKLVQLLMFQLLSIHYNYQYFKKNVSIEN